MLFAIVVAALVWAAILLGQWQFHRLDERKHDNRLVATNLKRAPAPVDDVLSTNKAPSASDEWRRVTVHGSWDDKHTIVLKYQTRDAGAGVDVVTPLVTESGTAVLVDRGWISTDNTGGSRPPDLPPVTHGQVTVTGWVRSDATGDATRVSDLSTRAISSGRIAEVMPYPLYRGFLDLAEESPPPAKSSSPRSSPTTPATARTSSTGCSGGSSGPSRCSASATWPGTSSASAACGATTTPQSARSMPPSTGSITPVTKDEAGLSRKAAAAANSAGSP